MRIPLEEIFRQTDGVEISTSRGNQIAVVVLPSGLKLQITVPDEIFEWYVEIFNHNNESLITDWYDHYDDSKENLTKEMTESIKEFVNDVTLNDSRVIVEKKFLGSKPIFQINKNEVWVDYFFEYHLLR